MSKKTYTLRGTIDFTGTGQAEERLFSYQANELDKGWIVRDAYVWDAGTTRVKNGTDAEPSQFYQLGMQLQTDTKGINANLAPDDNRSFGWYTANYSISSRSPYNAGPIEMMKILDPDHMITRELWANFLYSAISAMESIPCTLGYLIILEKVKTTAVENIFQTVKGIAQDVDN